MNKLNALSLGYAGAILSSGFMLLLGILGNLGIYEKGVEAMAKWHLFFSLSFFGIIAGMIEAAIISFIFLYAFAVLYNWSLKTDLKKNT